MLSLRINLLSPDKRHSFKSLMKFLFVKEMLEFAILTASMLAMMYLFAWWVLAQAMSDVVSSSLLVNREAPPINKDIQELNRQTKNINLSSQDFYPLSHLIFELSNVLPSDIKLVGVEFDRQKNSVTISGTAATRDALLNFQKVVSDLKWIVAVTAPTSQLFQKENITFEIKGSLQGVPIIRKN